MARQRPAPPTDRSTRTSGKGMSPLGLAMRVGAALALAWIGGFILFVLALPGRAAPGTRTEAVAVLTGGPGRLLRGAEVLKAGLAGRMLVSGVHPSVKPREIADAAGIPDALFACCVELGFEADSTRSNAEEVSAWVEKNGFTSLRLVTAAYHMPRARAELMARLPEGVTVVEDGVRAGLPLLPMLIEYAKFQASWAMLRVRPA